MTATQLILDLQELVNKFGDRVIEINGEYNNDYPLNTTTRLPVTRIDLCGDSENFQILCDNSD